MFSFISLLLCHITDRGQHCSQPLAGSLLFTRHFGIKDNVIDLIQRFFFGSWLLHLASLFRCCLNHVVPIIISCTSALSINLSHRSFLIHRLWFTPTVSFMLFLFISDIQINNVHCNHDTLLWGKLWCVVQLYNKQKRKEKNKQNKTKNKDFKTYTKLRQQE